MVLGCSAGYPDEYFSDSVFLKMLSSWFRRGEGELVRAEVGEFTLKMKVQVKVFIQYIKI